MQAYKDIETYFAKYMRLEHAQTILAWDEAVMMPQAASEWRAQAMAELSLVLHERMNQPKLKDMFANAFAKQDQLNEIQKANLQLTYKNYRRETALPETLVERAALANSRSEVAWRSLRQKNDWKGFAPYLEEVFAVAKEKAQIYQQVENEHRKDNEKLNLYEVMVDQYSNDLDDATIQKSFSELKKFIPSFLPKVLEKQKTNLRIPFTEKYPIEKQEKLAHKLMQVLGFDFKHGRLDTSHHPFCTGVEGDTRICTRYDETDFINNFMAIAHETGHALYEQNLRTDWGQIFLARAHGMAVHESQSLLFEMQLARSSEFIRYAQKMFVTELGLDERSSVYSVANLHRHVTNVTPSFIRVDADEVTYPMHVILRYEIERAILLGDIQVADIPEVWNEKMQKYLGLDTRDNYKDGCMQDVHWPAGLVGYFPAYTFGALIAAQLFAKIKSEEKNWTEKIQCGDLQFVKNWLQKNIWHVGKSKKWQQILLDSTGSELSTQSYLQHLQMRYLD